MSTRLDRVSKRGLRRLEEAIKESGGELSKAWIERDPDQAVIREADDAETWNWLVEGASGTREKRSKDAAKPEAAQLATPLRYDRKVRLPLRPWGRPRRRAFAWGIFAVVVIAVSAVGLVDYGLGVVLVLAFAAYRAGLALWENAGPDDGG